jgi:hypothetical protein
VSIRAHTGAYPTLVHVSVHLAFVFLPEKCQNPLGSGGKRTGQAWRTLAGFCRI